MSNETLNGVNNIILFVLTYFDIYFHLHFYNNIAYTSHTYNEYLTSVASRTFSSQGQTLKIPITHPPIKKPADISIY